MFAGFFGGFVNDRDLGRGFCWCVWVLRGGEVFWLGLFGCGWDALIGGLFVIWGRLFGPFVGLFCVVLCLCSGWLG